MTSGSFTFSIIDSFQTRRAICTISERNSNYKQQPKYRKHNLNHMSNFDGGTGRGCSHRGQEHDREIIVGRLIGGLVFPQRDSVEVAKEVVEVLDPLLVVQPVSLVGGEHQMVGVLVGEGLCRWVWSVGVVCDGTCILYLREFVKLLMVASFIYLSVVKCL